MKQINSLQGDSYICCETEVIINNVIELRKYLGNQKAQMGAIRSSVKRGGTAYGYHWDILERIS